MMKHLNKFFKNNLLRTLTIDVFTEISYHVDYKFKILIKQLTKHVPTFRVYF